MNTSPPSPNQARDEYNQTSFLGGMMLLMDDTRLQTNQYRIGFNVRNRFDRLDPVLSSIKDNIAPKGLKQEMTTFGNYEILFVAGKAYYKLYSDTGWQPIAGFAMSSTAPRYWTCVVPLTTTNYLRVAATNLDKTGAAFVSASQQGQINVNSIAGAFGGNIPGLVVQDNINQPQFIYIDNSSNVPVARTTQNFGQWSITFTDANNVTIAIGGDKREYVPIGNVMAFVDGVLYVGSQDGNLLLRSVEGRPLDFVINVTNTLVTVAPYTMVGGGDAFTTAYSVGVGPITTLHGMSDGSLFVGAANANFAVSKDRSNVAPKIFGEFTFVRKFLFNAVCLSDRAIIDTLGDTRFISLGGVRSFNAVMQSTNEGRNSPFSRNIAVVLNNRTQSIIQEAGFTSAVLFDDYELYSLDTTFGPAIAVYDTVNQCWSSFDVSQVGGSRVKQFVKIELSVNILYAITEDDNLYQLYAGPAEDVASFRTIGVCSTILMYEQNIKLSAPRREIKPTQVRYILDRITTDCSVSLDLFVNNRKSQSEVFTQAIDYKEPEFESIGQFQLDDVDTMLYNGLFSTPDAKQGWKMFAVFSWNEGSITQFSVEMNSYSPMKPARSQ